MKFWYSYEELREELLDGYSRLKEDQIVYALEYMEKENHNWANFGFQGGFIYSEKKEIAQ